MTTDTDVDHTADQCQYDWCLAHQACDCAFSSAMPHYWLGYRYRRGDDQDRGSGEQPSDGAQ